MPGPKVSLCVPTYNGAEFVEACLTSCVQQTYRNIEVIVVDDCSTDLTREIVEDFRARFDFVKLHVNESNLGLVGNWNRTVALATGDWVKPVFQDDFLEPECVEEFLKYDRPEVALMVSRRSFVLPGNLSKRLRDYYEKGVPTLDTRHIRPVGGVIDGAAVSRLAVRHIGHNFIAEPSLTLFRRSAFHEVGHFNADLAQICDFEFLLRLASQRGLVYVPERLCHFRVHRQSASAANHRDLEYTLLHLDPIVLVWHMLYGNQYEVFRRFLSHGQRFKLRTFLEARSFEAARVAADSPDDEKRFGAVAKKYREIGEFGQGGCLTRAVFALVKLRRKLRAIGHSIR